MWDQNSINKNYKLGDSIVVNLSANAIEGILSEVNEDGIVLICESETGESLVNKISFEYIIFITQRASILMLKN